MFDLDRWQEIYGIIRRNKLRTFLTVFGISWGLFMIILMLGIGTSFRNGITSMFSGYANNAGGMWGQRTTISYKGFQPGRSISFRNRDIEAISGKFWKEIEYLSPRNQLNDWGGGENVERGGKIGNFTVMGDHPSHINIEARIMEKGRFINEKDMLESRKVCVIGTQVQKILFEEDEDPIGQYISINKSNFMVVGLYRPFRQDGGNDQQASTVIVPFQTFQRAFNKGDEVNWFEYTVNDGYRVENVNEEIIAFLKDRLNISPLDQDAIGNFNAQEGFDEMQGLFDGIESFTWMVGIATILAGIIGVSNIMLIIIKERTKELGIRKAIGATPFKIISEIMQESVFLTFMGGYCGLIIGLLLAKGLGVALADAQEFGAVELDPIIIMSCFGILIVGGLIAGILPASRAVAIQPIEAIRSE